VGGNLGYNEEKTLEDVIGNIKNTMNKTRYDYGIQVVDDGSIDSTADIAKNLGVLVYSHNRNYGLAETFKEEISRALENGADIIVHIDADGQYDSEDIVRLVEPIYEGEADLVIGSRFLGTIEEMPFVKIIGNRMFSRVVSQITGIKITDAQTGYRAFTKEVAEKVNVNSTFTYTQEQIIKTVENKFRVKEIPIHFAKRTSGESRLMRNPLDYALKAGINLMRIYRDYAPLNFFCSIGVLLIIVSGLTYIYSSYIISNVMDITITILFLSGIQIILFGFLAEMVKK